MRLTPSGSHRGGEHAGSSVGKRDTVEHWRLVDDVVEPRARDVILKRTERSVIGHGSFNTLSAGFPSINAKPCSNPPGQAPSLQG